MVVSLGSKQYNMAAFLFYMLVLISLGIFVRLFWIQLAIIGAILMFVLGIVVCSAITAICFQFFSLMTSQLNDYGSFAMYFKYSAIFYIVAYIIYGCIMYDLFDIGIEFIQSVFRK